MSLSRTRKEQARALNGAWVSAEKHGFDGVTFKVRGRVNPDARALESRLGVAVPKDKRLPNGSIAPDEFERILNEVVLQTLLLDWQGLKEDEADADEIAFSPDKARELVTDPLLRPFRDAILLASAYVAEDGKETLETDAKN